MCTHTLVLSGEQAQCAKRGKAILSIENQHGLMSQTIKRLAWSFQKRLLHPGVGFKSLIASSDRYNPITTVGTRWVPQLKAVYALSLYTSTRGAYIIIAALFFLKQLVFTLILVEI